MKLNYLFLDGEFLPVIQLKVKGKEWLETSAYVDSGASYSIFHADVAEILGISLEDGELKEMVVGDGNVLKVYLHHLSVSLAGIEFIASIGFSKGIGTGFNILGRKTIFDKFLISFNEKEKWMEFQPLTP